MLLAFRLLTTNFISYKICLFHQICWMTSFFKLPIFASVHGFFYKLFWTKEWFLLLFWKIFDCKMILSSMHSPFWCPLWYFNYFTWTTQFDFCWKFHSEQNNIWNIQDTCQKMDREASLYSTYVDMVEVYIKEAVHLTTTPIEKYELNTCTENYTC